MCSSKLPVITVHLDHTCYIFQVCFIVYREGDIVKQPMKKGSFVPKNVPGVGWGGVGHVGVGWGGVGHVG